MLGQIISILAMAVTIVSFQMKTKKQILLFQTAGSTLFLISFILLESWAAACLNVVFIIRNIVFYFSVDKKWAQHQAWLYILLAAVIAAGVLGYRSWLDLIPIVGSVFGTLAAYAKHENLFRLFKLGDSPCWLIYNATVPSVGGVICEVFNIISIIIGLIRYRNYKGENKK